MPKNIATREEAIARIESINPLVDLPWEGSFGGTEESKPRTREEAGLVYNDIRPTGEAVEER